MNARIINPYVGPRTFLKEEGHLFFGREREARDLLGLVISGQLVLFYGQSGAGKSSLVNTRLIPNLESKSYEIFPTGRVSGDLPAGLEISNIYTYNLMRSLVQRETDSNALIKLSLTNFLAGLDADENGYFYNDRLLTETSEGNEALRNWPRVLIIDQFEELFSTHYEAWEKREDFFHQLSETMYDHPAISIVLVMREDYIASLAPYTYILPGGMRERYYLPRLNHDAALKAIKGPVAGLRPFAEDVAEKLVDDLSSIKIWKPDGTLNVQAGQYVEPVQLQVVCYYLWENLSPEGTQITEQDIQEVGDVNTSLGNYYAGRIKAVAEGVVAREKNVKERDIREWFGRELITAWGIRNIVPQEPGGKSGGLHDDVIHEFVKRGDLVQAETRGGATFYELTHDRLVEPIIENNKKWEEEHSSPLQRQATLWKNEGWNESWLLSDQALAEVEQWAMDNPGELTELDKEFLEVCRARQAERKAELEHEEERKELEATQKLIHVQLEREQLKNRANLLSRIIAIGMSIIIVALVYNIIATRGSQDTISIALWMIGSLILGYLLGRYSAK